MSLEFRRATREDATILAQLYRIASSGLADYIWRRLAAPGETPLEVGARRYARESTDFSYRNAVLALLDGSVAGMLTAYPVRPAVRPPDEFDFAIDDVLRPIDRLEQAESFYVSAMAVLPEHRGRGIGSRLLRLAEAEARDHRLSLLSLIVFEGNAGARRFYARAGFEETRRERLHPHPLLDGAGGYALLLVKRI
ncbi:MAG TPA: GNAT family N-acetyltransferase [Burkholderiales bacterium]